LKLLFHRHPLLETRRHSRSGRSFLPWPPSEQAYATAADCGNRPTRRRRFP
jgi:hypothetical protein